MLDWKQRLEIVKTYATTHKNEMVIFGVMFGISLAISIAMAGGDLGEAIAKGRR